MKNFLHDITDTCVHLWCVSLGSYSPDGLDYWHFLSREEKDCATRFRFEKDRRRYLVSHGAMRMILGSYLRREPQDVLFEKSRTGKPALQLLPGEPPITFNMSHSGDMMILGVTKNRRIGVDVELISSRFDFYGIAETHFTAGEVAEIREASGDGAAELFFSHWTCKEAYLKAEGCGLSHELPCCSPARQESVRVLDAGLAARMWPFGSWTVCSLKPAEGYVASVVVDGGLNDLVFVTINRPSHMRTNGTAVTPVTRGSKGIRGHEKEHVSSGAQASTSYMTQTGSYGISSYSRVPLTRPR